MRKFLLLLFIFIFCLVPPALCASIVIDNYTPEELKTVLMKKAVTEGGSIKNSSDYQLVIETKGSFWQDIFYSSNFNGYTVTRTTYNFIKDDKNTILNMDISIIRNPNSAYEAATPADESTLLTILDLMKKALNGYYGYGIYHIQHWRCLEIKESANPDIQPGDRIYKIGNESVINLMPKDIKRLLAVDKDKSTQTFFIKRGKEKFEIEVKSRFIEPTLKKENKK